MKRSRRGLQVLAWVFRVLLLLGLLAVIFLPPFPRSGEGEKETATITNYETSMLLTRDGTLSSEEIITTEMPPNKRGIFRIFDTADPRREGIEHPVSIESISRDGLQEPYEIVPGALGTKTARIGDSKVFLTPGKHTYRIISRTSQVLEPGKKGETLWWWDVVGQGWKMPMQSVSITAQLPTRPERAECVQGKDTPCTASIEGTSLRIQTGPLDPFTAVTVRVSFPSNALPVPSAGTSSTVSVALTLALSLFTGLLAAGLGLYLISKTREAEPGFPVLFEPPDGIFPALGVRVLDERDSSEDLQATLFDLAERGLLQLAGDDDQWTVTMTVDPATFSDPATLTGVSLQPAESSMLLAMGLGAQGSSFEVSKSKGSGEQISAARKALRAEVGQATTPYLNRSTQGLLAMIFGWLALLGSFFLIFRYFFGDPNSSPVWPVLIGLGVFTLVVLGMMFDPGVLSTRTEVGRQVWSRTGGFARFLTTDSSESRFEAAKHLDWYPKYLPWAVALGSADDWAQRYEAQGLETPQVPWILWAGTSRNYSMNDMNASFNSAIAGASAAYAASQASSGGGGGFSGGSGGGGGGGGSW
ncbi:MAG: DUF2207 domain-containing protein [Microthrixaceae bacterium]